MVNLLGVHLTLTLKEHNHVFTQAQEFDFGQEVKNSKMRELI